MNYFKGIGRKTGSYTGRKLPLLGLLVNKKYSINNKYVSGSGVGASSIAVRRERKKRARIKKCAANVPVIPEKILAENEFQYVADNVIQTNDIPNYPVGTSLDLGNTDNKNVDMYVYKDSVNKAVNAVNAVQESGQIDFVKFYTQYQANPYDVFLNDNNEINNDIQTISISGDTNTQNNNKDLVTLTEHIIFRDIDGNTVYLMHSITYS